MSRRLGAPLKGLPTTWNEFQHSFDKTAKDLTLRQCESNRVQMDMLLEQIRGAKSRGLHWLNIVSLLLSVQVLPQPVAEQICSRLSRFERILLPFIWMTFRFLVVVLRNIPVWMLVALEIRLDPVRLQNVLDRTRKELTDIDIASHIEEEAMFGSRERLSLMRPLSSMPALHTRILGALRTSASSFFCKFVRRDLEVDRLPRHLGVIMDGNRRFARSEKIPIGGGHAHGANKLRDVAMWSFGNGVSAVTAWGFSSDNFKRSEKEQTVLFALMTRELKALMYSGMVHAWRVRVHVIGDKSNFPRAVQEAALAVEQETVGYESHQLILALNYGGHDEIVDMAKRVHTAGLAMSKESMSQMTETARLGVRPVDVVQRTSDKLRISGFLLWRAWAQSWPS